MLSHLRNCGAIGLNSGLGDGTVVTIGNGLIGVTAEAPESK